MRTLLLLLLAAGLLAGCNSPGQAQGTSAQTSQVQTGQTQATQTQTTARQTPTTGTAARDPDSGLAWVAVSVLPREGQQLLNQIARGGPFRYSKDGVTFGNREGLLPRQTRGYYREYTVRTPGESDRGARRIVCGGQPETSTAECYYTADHYATFRRIRP
ncbi:ribonuclease [Deinococcus petrolearius]|uniref:Ribonuclease n=1 Tax=Deinococcus petrolearius TaxID=1751295 RepID=A0ABW1DMV0_9DEIO